MSLSELAITDGHLRIQTDQGAYELAAAHLRAACRCAPCEARRRRGEGAAQVAELTLVALTPVGGYAVQLHFSDGHARGIYPFAYLKEIARAQRDSRGA